MASSSSHRQNTNIISKKKVLKQLRNSRTFSWCVYRKSGIVRHVGFIIMFDGKPFCTVDFEVEILRVSCFVASCDSKVFFRGVPPDFENHVDYWGDVIQCLNTRDEDCRKRAEQIIHDLVTPNSNKYSLLLNNCRDNTRDAVNRVCDYGQCSGANLEDANQMLQETQCQDGRYFASILRLICMVVIAGVIGFLTKS